MSVLPIAINHMTVASKSLRELAVLAGQLGAQGVELRNDLERGLFDGSSPQEAATMIERHGLQVYAMAEVQAFNDWSDETRKRAVQLIDIAGRVGAKGISLIPRNDNGGLGHGERQANLRLALRELEPLLSDAGLVGLIEPLGFETSSLRRKDEIIDIVEALGMRGRFALIHDTFHHHLAGGGPVFANETAVVHVSGVTDGRLATNEMRDADRVLVDEKDRLGNLDQLRALMAAGYRGPISFEAFAPEIKNMREPRDALAASIQFIRRGLAPMAA